MRMRDDTSVTEEERKWGTVAHLSAFLGLVIPLGNVLGPLAILLVMKEKGEFVEFNAKEALNFQISMTIYAFIAAITIVLLIGFVLLPLVVLADLILIVKASMEASEKKRYEYPFTMRFV